jgi:hypothetical protein
MSNPIEYGTLANLALVKDGISKRASSFDRTGGNADYWRFAPGETRVIADLKGTGCIKHIWITISAKDLYFPRRVLLRIFWDNETTPSVEVPAGDFFGIGHGITKNFSSLPLSMTPRNGRGFNCYFPMPFGKRARIEIANHCDNRMALYFYIDYQLYRRKLGSDVLRFHAQWRRANPCKPDKLFKSISRKDWPKVWAMPNLDGKHNYVILEAQGRGHYVGCNLNIDVFKRQKNDWYGEGDDMIFIDGAKMPTINGTGTEDYFGTAWCPQEEFCTPYNGITLYSGTKKWLWGRKNSMYRYHIEDPIIFKKSIKVTIEHGHANSLENDYSSTAYWYQNEPHIKFPKMPAVADRLPRD